MVVVYGNEESVGKVIVDSGVVCEDLFVMIKLWNVDYGYDVVKKVLDILLVKLGLDYVDFYLIYWLNLVVMCDNWE